MTRNPVQRNIQGSLYIDDWADVYVGTCDIITSAAPLVEANYSDQRVNFEGTVLVDCCDYVYVAAWSNKLGRNGLVAEFAGTDRTGSGDAGWEVFATGQPRSQAGVLYDGAVRPSIYEINRGLAGACAKGWSTPSVLPRGATGMNSTEGITGTWIWHDSGSDSSTGQNPPVPFLGHDHDELLIFRVPVQKLFLNDCSEECPKCDCGCNDGCNGCIEGAGEKNDELISRANQAFNDVEALANPTPGTDPFNNDCRGALAEGFDGRPFFFLHWGQSAGDTIESHDTEVLYITVRNPFADLEYRGFRLGSVEFDPVPPMAYHATIVPDRLVDYGCIPPCSSVTREFAVITRNSGEYIGPVNLNLEYCFDELAVMNGGQTSGTASFELTIVEDD